MHIEMAECECASFFFFLLLLLLLLLLLFFFFFFAGFPVALSPSTLQEDASEWQGLNVLMRWSRFTLPTIVVMEKEMVAGRRKRREEFQLLPNDFSNEGLYYLRLAIVNAAATLRAVDGSAPKASLSFLEKSFNAMIIARTLSTIWSTVHSSGALRGQAFSDFSSSVEYLRETINHDMKRRSTAEVLENL